MNEKYKEFLEAVKGKKIAWYNWNNSLYDYVVVDNVSDDGRLSGQLFKYDGMVESLSEQRWNIVEGISETKKPNHWYFVNENEIVKKNINHLIKIISVGRNALKQLMTEYGDKVTRDENGEWVIKDETDL